MANQSPIDRIENTKTGEELMVILTELLGEPHSITPDVYATWTYGVNNKNILILPLFKKDYEARLKLAKEAACQAWAMKNPDLIREALREYNK